MVRSHLRPRSTEVRSLSQVSHLVSHLAGKRAHRSYLNEVEELALGGMVPRRPWLSAFFGRGA